MWALRRLTMRVDERVARWLWFAVAYVTVVLVLVWLGEHLRPPASPPSGWFE